MCAICGSVGPAAAAGTANAVSAAKANNDLEIIGLFPSGGTVRRCGKPFDGAMTERFPARAESLGSASRCAMGRMADYGIGRRSLLGGGAAAIAAFALLRSPGTAAGSALSFKVNHSPEEWKSLLGPQRYAVLREASTEHPFTSP